MLLASYSHGVCFYMLSFKKINCMFDQRNDMWVPQNLAIVLLRIFGATLYLSSY